MSSQPELKPSIRVLTNGATQALHKIMSLKALVREYLSLLINL